MYVYIDYLVLVSLFSRIFCVYETKHILQGYRKIAVCMRPEEVNNKKVTMRLCPFDTYIRLYSNGADGLQIVYLTTPDYAASYAKSLDG